MKYWLLHIFTLLNVLTFSLQSSANAIPLPDKPHIIVQGYGGVEQVPDIIRLKFEVFVTAPSLREAKLTVDRKVAAAIDAATQEGTDEDNINASKINASPEYQWRTKNREYVGERVSRQIEIVITKPEKYNDVVNALLSAGIDRLQQPQLDFSNRKELEKIALKRALDDAKLQAETIVNHLDGKIKAIFQIAPVDRPMIMQRMEMAAADSNLKSAPLKLGKQSIEQRVRVVYLLSE